MIRLLVIADDFTGALDTAIQFNRKNIPTYVTMDLAVDYQKLNQKFEILVINTESRHLNSEEAYSRIQWITQNAMKAGVRYFYKKTDSTLRGNLGSELTALKETTKTKALMFIPAFPKNNRVTRNGLHYVDGELLHQTAFGKDPFNPVKTSNVAEILKEQSKLKMVNIVDADVAASAINEGDIYIFDGETMADLDTVGECIKRLDGLKVMAGCAGFAEILPDLLLLRKSCQKTEIKDERFVFLSGSVNEKALMQLNEAEKNGNTLIKLSDELKLSENLNDSDLLNQIDQAVEKAWREKGVVLICSITDNEELKKTIEKGMEKGLSLEKIRSRIAQNMGVLIKKISEKLSIVNLVVFGGDTLLGVVKALDAQSFVPMEEIASGVVLSKLVSENHAINIITKAGGLGDPDIIKVITNYLKAKAI
ncbi:four-carbon acid sugar kinase family protein [Acetobacterium bakii]|uniref:Four-carbon acid sugar kinase family protein n=1 Tax=Acetobacterium bakii TaxID=52689 RepID=A0A0L6TV65_9FIRM|nr:four-carbon acid sugar kinase family protein [Acetobacterium bakii]KNZ40166.1 hypothetical protein AKG39_19125 [Acetobacterium bakii]